MSKMEQRASNQKTKEKPGARKGKADHASY